MTYLLVGVAMALWLRDLWYRGFGLFLAGLSLWMLPRSVRLMVRPGVILIDRDGVERRLLAAIRRRWRDIESAGPVRSYFTAAVVLRCKDQKPLWLQPWGMPVEDLENLIAEAKARWAGIDLAQQPEIDLTRDAPTSDSRKTITQRILGLGLVGASFFGYLQIGARYQSPDGRPLDARMQWDVAPSQSDLTWFALQVLAVGVGGWLVAKSRPTWLGRSFIQFLWGMGFAAALVGVFGLARTIDLGSVWLGLTYGQHQQIMLFAKNFLTPGLTITFIGIASWFQVRKSLARIRQGP